jgi:hypothetical protein
MPDPGAIPVKGGARQGSRLVLLEGIELSTSPLPRGCSTTELQQRRSGNTGAAGYTARQARRARQRLDVGWQGSFLCAMDNETDTKLPARPTLTKRAAADLAARRAREAASLRTNLRRRKEQARAREQKLPEAGEIPK